jgi:hypothetical protein
MEAAAQVTAKKAAKKRVDPFEGLRLEATCLSGDQRLALINGQIYAPQKKSAAGKPSTPPFRVVSVFPNTVLLERDGQTVELTYEGIVSRPGAAPRAMSSKGTSAKLESLKRDLHDTKAVTGDASRLKKPSGIAPASQPVAKKQSGNAGD